MFVYFLILCIFCVLIDGSKDATTRSAPSHHNLDNKKKTTTAILTTKRIESRTDRTTFANDKKSLTSQTPIKKTTISCPIGYYLFRKTCFKAGDYDDRVDAWADGSASTTASNFEIGLTYALLGLSLMGIILVVVCSILFPSRNPSIRWYCINLMLCGLVHVVLFAYNSQKLNPALQKAIGRLFHTKKSYDFGPYVLLSKYSNDIQEWYGCVYAFTSSILSMECVFRYVFKKYELSHVLWFIIVLVSDFIPFVYIVLKNEGILKINIAPPPLTSYHAILIIVIGVEGAVFLIFVIALGLICPINQNQWSKFKFNGNSVARKKQLLEYKDLAGIVLYGIFTILFQYTCVVYLIQTILNSFGKAGSDAAIKIATENSSLVATFLMINDWSMVSMVFVQSMAILLCMPSYPGQYIYEKYFSINDRTQRSVRIMPKK